MNHTSRSEEEPPTKTNYLEEMTGYMASACSLKAYMACFLVLKEEMRNRV